jgi:RHS repeat-associated protein
LYQVAVAYNLRFPGQYYDAETGLNQNWNRDYDPLIAKYIESDPTGLRAGINTYGYATPAMRPPSWRKNCFSSWVMGRSVTGAITGIGSTES